MENPSAMKRSALMLLAGLFAGLVIGVSFSHSRSDQRNSSAAASNATTANALSTHDHSSASSADKRDVVLGDIITVPFQELYGVLSTLPRARLNELVNQLAKLPPGQQTESKIAAFFRAWAHFDPVAALRASSLFGNAQSRTTAAEAVIEGADFCRGQGLS